MAYIHKLNLLLILVLAISMLQGCSQDPFAEDDCVCTLKACGKNNAPPDLKVYVEEDPNDPSEFSRHQYDQFKVVWTDNKFRGVDTFPKGLYSLPNHKLKRGPGFEINNKRPNPQGDSRDIRNFNCIILTISDTTVIQQDTVEDVTYQIDKERKVCNRCTGGPDCEDEYFIYKDYHDKSLTFNKSVIKDSLAIRLRKK